MSQQLATCIPFATAEFSGYYKESLQKSGNGVQPMKAYRNLCLTALLMGAASLASAAQVEGVLMDKACSMSAAKEGQKFAMSHDTKCALAPDCAKSGYGVFTSDGKFMAFDAAGNAKAAAALKATKKADNLMVTVNGDVAGDTITVASLKLK